MTNASALAAPSLLRDNDPTASLSRARRELREGVDHMLTYCRVDSVEALPDHAKLYLSTLFYAAFPGWLDDFSAGELHLHTTLLANLQADANGATDALERQRDF